MDAPDSLKRIHSIITRGYFKKGNVMSAVYGTRDLFNWQLIWTSKDHYLRGYSGTPYKYFMVVLETRLNENTAQNGEERIAGFSVDFDTAMTNQQR